MCSITDAIVHEFIVSLPSAPQALPIEESETSPHRARQECKKDSDPGDCHCPNCFNVQTECAICNTVQPCYDDGEAYICIERGACRVRVEASYSEPGGSGGGSGGPATIAGAGHEAIAAATTAATFTCEQCLETKPETDFATVLQAPLGSPCICDGCLNDVCWSCGDQLDAPGYTLCPACHEAGETYPEIGPTLVSCTVCNGPHRPTQCPEITREWQRQERLARAGRGIWRHYRQERTRFLLAVQRAASTDLLAMAEAMAHYLTESNETQIEVSPDRVLRCWQRELGMPA